MWAKVTSRKTHCSMLQLLSDVSIVCRTRSWSKNLVVIGYAAASSQGQPSGTI